MPVNRICDPSGDHCGVNARAVEGQLCLTAAIQIPHPEIRPAVAADA